MSEKDEDDKKNIKDIALPAKPPPPALKPSLRMTAARIRLDIMKNNVLSSLSNINISLRSPYSRCELSLPVRNSLCPCLWDMSEIMTEQIFDQQDDEVTTKSLLRCYFCKESELEEGSGRRYIDKFFVDKELAMYIGRAKKLYQAQLEPYLTSEERKVKSGATEEVCVETAVKNILQLGLKPVEVPSSAKEDQVLETKAQPPKDSEESKKTPSKRPKDFKYGQIKIEDIGGKVVTYHLQRIDGTTSSLLIKDDRRSFTDYKLNSHHSSSSLNNFVSLSTSLGLMQKQLNHKANVLEKISRITDNGRLPHEALAEDMGNILTRLLHAGDEREFTFAFNHDTDKRKKKQHFDQTGLRKDQEKVYKPLYIHVLIPFRGAYFKSKLILNVKDYSESQPALESEPHEEKQPSTALKVTGSVIKSKAVDFLCDVDRAVIIKDKLQQRVYVINADEGELAIQGDKKCYQSRSSCFYTYLKLHGVQLSKSLAIGRLSDLPADYRPVYAAGTIHHQVLYVFGGKTTDGKVSNLAYKLDLSQAEWGNGQAIASIQWKKIKEDMPEPRHSHSCFVHEGRIYLVGGFRSAEEIGQNKQVEAVESNVLIYDPSTEKWQTKQVLPLAKHLPLERFIVCKLTDWQYLFVHGSNRRASIFDARIEHINCYIAGQNANSSVDDIYVNQKQNQVRPRQIYDSYIEPVYGLFYLMTRNRDNFLRVLYGNNLDWRMLVVDPDAASHAKNISQKVMQTAGGKRQFNPGDSVNSSFIYDRD